MLYVGLEHGLMNNVRLANSFFTQAHSLAPDDPFVLHELGTVAYQNDEFVKAEKCFTQAMEMVRQSSDGPVDDTWEPLLNNLGHVCRKLKKYNMALEYHQKVSWLKLKSNFNFILSSFFILQALLVSPCRASTYASMGYVYSLTGKAAEAVEYFQKALALKRDDTFSTTMLNFVLDSYLSEAPPFPGAPAEVPAPKTPLPTGMGLGLSRNAVKVELPATISSSNMEMSNVSMADISEEENPQMDTPDSVYGKTQRQFIQGW
jgi:anaphase-promoting complex subunit 6